MGVILKGCQRCGGDLCQGCYKWGHCLNCGWHALTVAPSIAVEVEHNAGRKELKALDRLPKWLTA